MPKSDDTDKVVLNEEGVLVALLAGTELKLRPSYSAFLEIERVLKCGVVEFSRRMADQKFSLSDIVTILHAGSQAAGQKYDKEYIGNVVIEAGLWPDVVTVTMNFLSVGLGGYTRHQVFPVERSPKNKARKKKG